MPEPIYVVIYFALYLIKMISMCMFIRAILSWFNVNGNNPIIKFLYVVTEPAIQPMRKLFQKMNWFQDTPIDMSFSMTFILIFVLETVIETVIL